jgi:glycosyltransferase involved in cell wall biosynthesis
VRNKWLRRIRLAESEKVKIVPIEADIEASLWERQRSAFHACRVSGRALVGLGDVNDVRHWGGHPYFFLKAGQRNGLFQAGIALHPERFRKRRLVWNALQLALLKPPGGIQYSQAYVRRVWADRNTPADIGEYVSHFPLVPPRDIVREPVVYYIDATLHQNFEGYVGRRIGKRLQAEALAREREAFLAARFVVGWSRWCANDVESFYGVSPDKVRVISPGAGVDETCLPAPAPWDGRLTPLRLGFIGEDWERKRGPVLLDVASALERMGYLVEVIVIGPPVSALPSHPALRAVGFVDKSRDLPRFVDLVRSFHFGCLLSRHEPFGVSNLECIRLGIPVIGTAVDGIPETVPDGAGFLVPAEESGEAIAERLSALIASPDEYARMRDAAQDASALQTWDRTAERFLALLRG